MADLPGFLPDDALFKCTCDGENSNCIHCDGTGWTKRPIGLRSDARSPPLRPPSPKAKSNAKAESFLSVKEKHFARQVSNEMPRLRNAFFEQTGNNTDLFTNYIQRVIDALDPRGRWIGVATHSLASKGLKGFAMDMERLRNSPNEDFRILARTARACLSAYDSTLAQKKHQPSLKRPSARQITTGQPGIACPHCGKPNHNQDQHNQLFHPELRARPARVKPPKPAIQAPALSSPASMSAPAARAAPAAKPERYQASNRRRPSPIPATIKNLDHARANTDPVERTMDAHRTWGGRFRDTNGTFGSYPLHDSMDDESNAG